MVQRLARLAQSYDSCVISAESAHFTLMLNLKNEGRTFLFQLHSEFSLSANQISVRVWFSRWEDYPSVHQVHGLR